jgi:uncharacterized membrane protein YeaQ/YmgE (transglycosylase-associated protein family)
MSGFSAIRDSTRGGAFTALPRASMRCRRGDASDPRRNEERGTSMSFMGFVWMAVVGLVVGALARFFYPGAVPMGFLGTILLGVVGSLVGGFIGSLFSRGKAGIQPAGLLMSVVGSVLVLWIWLNYMK